MSQALPLPAVTLLSITAGGRSQLGRVTVAVLAALLMAAIILSMTTGASGASAEAVIKGWFGFAPENRRRRCVTMLSSTTSACPACFWVC